MSITKLTTNGVNGSKYDTVSADNYYMEPIATTLVGAGGVASVDFTNIPQGYKHLQIRWIGQHAGANVNVSLAIQFNGDTGSNYVQHRLYGDGSSAQAVSATSTTFIRSDRLNSPTSASSIFGVGIIDILDYANVYKFKTIRSLGGVDSNGSGFIALDSGLWMNTAAISSIKLYGADPGNLSQYSRFSLFGVKA